MARRKKEGVTYAFVDTETTGGSFLHHRIIEIAIILVRDDRVIERWSSLVHPGRSLPPLIQDITGITDEDLYDAPTFDSIADDVLSRLQGAVFVAHNARFDYAFVKNELRRAERKLQAKTLCTVRLSRLLHPSQKAHNLDAIIERFDLDCEDRHRALADADAMLQFWVKARKEAGDETFAWAVKKLLQTPSLPTTIHKRVVDDLPETPGVYVFLGKNRRPIYIGKSVNIRARVLSHFAGDHSLPKDMKITQEIVDIECHQTAGELGALLLESQLIKAHMPLYNRMLRRVSSRCVYVLEEDKKGFLVPTILRGDELTAGQIGECYGFFATRRSAEGVLSDVAAEHGLCPGVLGLEATKRGEPCFSYHLKKCRGACAGDLDAAAHNVLLLTALGDLRQQRWPFDGFIGIRETCPETDRQQIHVFSDWTHVGSCDDEDSLQDILTGTVKPDFNVDTYKIVKSFLHRALQKNRKWELLEFPKSTRISRPRRVRRSDFADADIEGEPVQMSVESVI
jgi:DNA polymerase III subunit epsilon